MDVLGPAEGAGAHVSFLSTRSAEAIGRRVGLDLRDSVPLFRYRSFLSYARDARRSGRGPVTALKYLFHCSRLSAGRCYWYAKRGGPS